jgi:single-strand DNA-binding protein
VAVDNPGKTGADKTASFIPCTCWSKTAEFVSKYFVKGSLIGIDGRLNQRSYEDKNGQKRSVVEVIGESVQFIEKKGASADAGDSQPQPDETSNAPEAAPSATPAAHEGIDGADDDLPF